MTKILIWEKLEHHIVCVILLESYLVVSDISIQRMQTGIITIFISTVNDFQNHNTINDTSFSTLN